MPTRSPKWQHNANSRWRAFLSMTSICPRYISSKPAAPPKPSDQAPGGPAMASHMLGGQAPDPSEKVPPDAPLENHDCCIMEVDPFSSRSNCEQRQLEDPSPLLAYLLDDILPPD